MIHDDSLLDGLRSEGDPELDPIIVDLLDRGGLDEVNASLRAAMTNQDSAPESLPPRLRAFLASASKLTEGIDEARIDRATTFFVDHGLSIAALLGLASLLECYGAKKGVKALHATDNMGYSGAEKRVGETAQFVMQVMTPRGLFEGRAVSVLLKVRMMHAASRALIRRLPTWDEEENGLPINQEDLLATLLTFGYSPTLHLPKLGVAVTADEAEDFLYFWTVAGRILGVRPDILPRSVDEARLCLTKVQQRHWAPCDEGRELTAALVTLLAQLVPGASTLTGLVPGLARYLVGNELCDTLGVPSSSYTPVFRGGRFVLRTLNRVQDSSVVVRRFANRLGHRIMDGESLRIAGGKAQFRIPTALRRAWRLPPADCGPRAVSYARALAEQLANPDAGVLPEQIVELSVLVAAADGETDDLEVESLLQLVRGLAMPGVGEEDLRARVSSAANIAVGEHAARAEQLGTRIRGAAAVEPAIELAITIAYANTGLADEERTIIEAIGRGADLAPLRLEHLVGKVAAAIDPEGART